MNSAEQVRRSTTPAVAGGRSSVGEKPTVLVTGGTGGIGQATATALAGQGATVIVTGRDRQRGEAAVEAMRVASQNPRIYFLKADLSRQRDARDLAARIRAHHKRLDVLVNNVGGLYSERIETEDGMEATLATNLLNPFLLTCELLPLLHASGPARIVNVSSEAHRFARVDFSDVYARASYRGFEVFARAKLFNLLWTYELARRLEDTAITVNAADPGRANTPMIRALKPKVVPAPLRVLWPVLRMAQRGWSAEKAAQSSIYLASSPEVTGVSGAYVHANGQVVRSSAASYDTLSAAEVWLLCERLLKLDRLTVDRLIGNAAEPKHTGTSQARLVAA